MPKLFLAGLSAVLLAVVAFAARPAAAAELIMFEQAGCVWCAKFNREIAPIYPKTDEGKIAPLRRVDIYAAVPNDLKFVIVERITPVFVLVDRGREIGRIRGYPGEDNFWGLLANLVKKIDAPKSDLLRTENTRSRSSIALN
jgi:thioredoxin-related protein